MANTQASQLLAVRRAIEKRYTTSTELFPDFRKVKPIEVHPTPSAIINTITGLGGLPRGRVTEIYGPEATGKTTIGLECIAAVQQATTDSVCAFIDYEHAMDPIYARKLGVDLNIDRFVYAQPDYFEQGDDIIDDYLNANLVDLYVIDSAAAMIPKAELEGEIDTKDGSTGRVGLQAMLMARMMSRITKKLGRGRKPALLIINQTRTKLDFNNPRNTGEDSAGGKALRFYTSIRMSLEITRKEGEEKRGTAGTDQVFTRNLVRVTAVKNKLAPPFQRGLIQIDYGVGINNVASIGALAEAHLGIMSGAGFFNYKGDSALTSFSCRGREEFHKVLKETPQLVRELEAKVLARMRTEVTDSLGIREIAVEEPPDDSDPIQLSDETDELAIKDA